MDSIMNEEQNRNTPQVASTQGPVHILLTTVSGCPYVYRVRIDPISEHPNSIN